jgi:hypothetical protein
MGRRRGRRKGAGGGAWRVVLPAAAAVGLGLAGVVFLGLDTEGGPSTPPLGEPARALERGDGSGLPAPWDRIRVEVLNAGGVPGMAARARDHLRSAGFDVVYYGNHEAFDREVTAVLDRAGKPEAARLVAGVFGVEEPEHAPDTTRLVDVTVLLGRSWTPVEQVGWGLDPGGGAGRWWDPRRLVERLRPR